MQPQRPRLARGCEVGEPGGQFTGQHLVDRIRAPDDDVQPPTGRSERHTEPTRKECCVPNWDTLRWQDTPAPLWLLAPAAVNAFDAERSRRTPKAAGNCSRIERGRLNSGARDRWLGRRASARGRVIGSRLLHPWKRSSEHVAAPFHATGQRRRPGPTLRTTSPSPPARNRQRILCSGRAALGASGPAQPAPARVSPTRGHRFAGVRRLCRTAAGD